MRRGRVSAPLALATLAWALAARGAPAQTGSARWDPDDRVLIRDFSHVLALARGPDRVYAATTGGLISYDDVGGVFDLPLTIEDGWPEVPARALTYDDRDASLWLATEDGRLLQLYPDTRRFAQEVSVGEPVSEVVPGERSGSDLFVRVRSGWLRVDVFLREVRPADPSRVAAEVDRTPDARRRRELLEDPGFRSVAPFLGDAAGTRPAPVVDVVPARSEGRYWVGTDGGFLVEYDHLTRSWTPLAFGPLGEGMAAVAREDDRLWFFPRDSRGGRFGVARADHGLQRWEVWPTDSVPGAPRPPLRAALSTAGVVWAGGAGGLWRFADGQWRRLPTEGLPSPEVTALAATTGGEVWVGTARGAALISAAGDPLGPQTRLGSRVLALSWFDGALWVGTPEGLYLADPVTGREAPAAGPGSLRLPAGALVSDGERLYAGLGGEVWSRDRGTEWERVAALGTGGGPVRALAVRAGALWIGSDEGLVLWDPGGEGARRYSFVSGDLPSERGRRGIAALLSSGEGAVWASTPAGALWIRAE